MTRHTPKELRARLALDYEVVRGMSPDGLGAVRAFASRDDLRKGFDISAKDAAAGQAVLYAVEYRFDHLVGTGSPGMSSIAVFDLLARGNYPFSSPLVNFVSRPTPWNPRVSPIHGVVCIGSGWKRARGRRLLAHLIVDVMRFMNFDEPNAMGSDAGLNPEAKAFWLRVLGGRPRLPDLTYPRPPSEITHGVEAEAEDVFLPIDDEFRPIGDTGSPEEDVFIPLIVRF